MLRERVFAEALRIPRPSAPAEPLNRLGRSVATVSDTPRAGNMA